MKSWFSADIWANDCSEISPIFTLEAEFTRPSNCQFSSNHLVISVLLSRFAVIA